MQMLSCLPLLMTMTNYYDEVAKEHRMINLHITNVTNLVLKSSDNEGYDSHISSRRAKVEIRCSQNVTFTISFIN